MLLALVMVTALPYLYYWRERRAARVLLLTLVRWRYCGLLRRLTYNLAGLIAGHSSTSTAVSITLGSQPTPPHGTCWRLGPGLVWLGLFGAYALVVSIRYLARPAQVAAAVTVLLWSAAMYGQPDRGGRLPQRFERDLGAPLAWSRRSAWCSPRGAAGTAGGRAHRAHHGGRRGRRGGRGRGGGPGRP